MSEADGGFKVTRRALEVFAQASQLRAEGFAQCLSEARQLSLSSDAFGRLPVISARVNQAYQSYVSGCEKGIGQAATTMSQVKGGIYATIAYCERADTAVEDHAAAVAWEAIQPDQITSPGEPAP